MQQEFIGSVCIAFLPAFFCSCKSITTTSLELRKVQEVVVASCMAKKFADPNSSGRRKSVTNFLVPRLEQVVAASDVKIAPTPGPHLGSDQARIKS